MSMWNRTNTTASYISNVCLNPQHAGYILSGKRGNFLYVESSTAWLYDCPQFLSFLYEADKCFDHIPIYYKDTVMYIDPRTRQTFNYVTPISCEDRLCY